MGVGIWSMHFIGMLALSLPIPMGYDPSITLLSLLIAIGSSAFALWTVCRVELSWSRLTVGAVLMGSGISAMHYTGMAAMRMVPGVQYDPTLFALSIFIAIVASGVGLGLAFHLRQGASGIKILRMLAGVIMGFAIAGTHYTGMAAARFPSNSICAAARSGMNNGSLALYVILGTVSILSVTLIVSESRTAVLATSLADANQELTYLALHDNLTKLPNRLLLEDRIHQLVERARRNRSRFCVMFIDLDGFKGVNDAFGHHIGDLLLQEVASRCHQVLRAQDTLARMGGDEFVLLCDAGEAGDAVVLAAKVLEAVQRPFEIADHDLNISASIGISIYAEDDEDAETVLRNADAAMYRAKVLGGNCYCFFDSSMSSNARERFEMLRDLRLAIENREFVLHYQPKFDMSEGLSKMVGVEALLRWRHPVRGLVEPSEFIPIAEKTGLIVPIGAWVLDEACRQVRDWENSGNTGWSVAVNLSSAQFSHRDLTNLVCETLQRHQLQPERLILEVTESMAMSDVNAGMTILQALRDAGVQIAIDDFGTGYSTMLNLKRLPASEIKIDRAFIRDLLRNDEDTAVISTILDQGRTFNVKVVAEGVETLEQQEILMGLGCTSMQGYLLGPPVAPEQVKKLALTGLMGDC